MQRIPTVDSHRGARYTRIWRNGGNMRALSIWAAVAACTLGLVASGCGGGGSGGGGGGSTTSATVGAAGGTFALGDSTITVPPGALTQDVTITVRDGTAVVSGGDAAAGRPLLFEPAATTFGAPFTLKLPVDAALLTAAGKTLADVVVLYRDETTGVVTRLTVTATGSNPSTVTVQVSKLGTLQAAVPGVVDAAASSVVVNTPAAVAGSQTVTVSVTARNAANQVLPGVTVVLAATGTGNTLTQPTAVTNAQGVATGTLASSTIETKTISATANGVALTQQATVSFGTQGLSITSPVPGDRVPVGVPLRVTFASTLVGTATLEFSTNAGASYTTIATGLTGSQTTWTPPGGTTSARLRLSAGGLQDQQVGDFTFVNVLFVDPAAAGVRDGLTWGTALARIQTALDLNTADEVWVANGTAQTALNPGDDFVVMVLNDAHLVGGFTGTETALSQRAASFVRTTIDGEAQRQGIQVDEGRSLTLEGFRVHRGRSFDGGGGGLHAPNASLTVRSCTFESNQADIGAAIFACTSPALTVSDCEFKTNTARFQGAAILSDDRVGGGRTLLVERCTFTQNTTTTPGSRAAGGAVFAYGKNTVTLRGCTFTQNSSHEGGALFALESNATVEDCTFDRNQATRNGGGAAYLFGRPTITGSTFVGNTSGGDGTGSYGRAFGGGGLSVEQVPSGQTGAVRRSSFFANQSTHGAGVFVKQQESTSGLVLLENCVLAENVASQVGGGAFLGPSARLNLSFCTLSRNQAPRAGGYGLMTDPSQTPSTISGSILFGDLGTTGKELGSVDTESLLAVTDSLVEGDLLGDPLFVNPAVRDYKLGAGSPAIGLGPTVAPAVDRDNLPRDGDPDAGAFERR